MKGQRKKEKKKKKRKKEKKNEGARRSSAGRRTSIDGRSYVRHDPKRNYLAGNGTIVPIKPDPIVAIRRDWLQEATDVAAAAAATRVAADDPTAPTTDPNIVGKGEE